MSHSPPLKRKAPSAPAPGTRGTNIAKAQKQTLGDSVATQRTSTLAPYIYDQGPSSGKLEHQVKYGPSAQLGKAEMATLHSHYGADSGPRLSQYSSNREHYATAAKLSGRPLTLQEHDVSKGKDPGSTSINHLIASGTGQNALNRTTLQYRKGKADLEQARERHLETIRAAKDAMSDEPALVPDGPSPDQRKMIFGFASQAAAVGRMTSLGRAILSEEHASLGYGKSVPTTAPDKAVAKRNLMVKDVLKSFQGGDRTERLEGYKGYLKNTFDSFGNLRLGHGGGNGRVSTGYDMPLDSKLQPTPRGERLHQALQDFGLPDMVHSAEVQNTNYNSGKKTTIRTGVFTTNKAGQKLSSSREV
jgi:hypothetical protein